MPSTELIRISPSETEQPFEAEYFLPAVQVDNEVEWVNPNVELPFSLVPGSSTEVALIVLPHDSSIEADAMVLGVWGHRRSVLIAREPFSDKQGVVYRDIDSKGSGYVDWSPEKRQLVGEGFNGGPYGDMRGSARGLLDIGSARRDQAFGEIFSEGGVRVVLPLAIIRLKQIIDKDGKKISIDEARRSGILAEDFDPAIELRGFGTRHRLDNWGFMGPGMSMESLKDAMTLVANEVGLDSEEFTPRAYLLWFAKTLGEQLRKIHEMGFAHAGLHSQNLTLDCRLADLDTAHSIELDHDKRAQVIHGEGLGSSDMVGYLRKSVAEYYPELKRNNSDELDELDNDIKRAYEEGYGEITDGFVYGKPDLDETN